MRTISAVESISLDGVAQGPGRPDEDPRGGFTHGGWAAPYAADPVQGRVMGVLGSGRRLFDETGPHASLRLRSTTPTGAGVLINHYVREA